MAEAIDPISGAGAVPARRDPKNTGKKTVEPVEKTFKQPVKSGLYKSAIGQAISQRDLENMTSQIQVARKLGDSVMEMEDTPPEVLKALDQAAQKNGYRNWADVKANPRSESAVMTVAKLANTILRTTVPHHEKIFYKSKTDENFADKKVSGKSRPGRVKRAGASCAGSVTDLRARAKKYGGEKGKMYHWCANMKSGKKK
jgi:2',3'-cyclic-nucleotide 2'-phosphodiesterase (5'-nucleotidase family)